MNEPTHHPHTESPRQMSAAVLTLSDAGSRGERPDTSGDIAEAVLRQAGFDVVSRHILADDRDAISTYLRRLCDDDGVALIVTTGGTGLGPRDVTPEATLDVIDRALPGMAEAMRMESLKKTPFAMTSRQVVGARGSTLIVNLPGSPKAVRECLDVILPVLPHTLDILAGRTRHQSSD